MQWIDEREIRSGGLDSLWSERTGTIMTIQYIQLQSPYPTSNHNHAPTPAPANNKSQFWAQRFDRSSPVAPQTRPLSEAQEPTPWRGCIDCLVNPRGMALRSRESYRAERHPSQASPQRSTPSREGHSHHLFTILACSRRGRSREPLGQSASVNRPQTHVITNALSVSHDSVRL